MSDPDWFMEDVGTEGVAFPCPNCRRELRLWFNGGELDQVGCCGMLYRLTYGDAPLHVERLPQGRA